MTTSPRHIFGRLGNALTLTAIMLTAMLTGCLKDDIPYPHIHANFLSINAEGESRAALIDSTNCRVTIYLPEEANIFAVKISDYTLTPDAEIAEGDIKGHALDLSEPYSVTLRLYQDYPWTIRASQDIERYLVLSGQVGTSVIDVPGRRVVANITDKTDIKSVLVEQCKLGPAGSTTTPDIEGRNVDFSSPLTLDIDIHGHIEQWTIYVQQTHSTVSTTQADGWTCVGWIYGEALAGKKNTVQYRIKGDTEWLTVPDEWLTVNGGSFYARLTGLTPGTTYEGRAVSDDEYGETLTFTTGTVVQLPDSNFDQWWLDGKVWDPWPQDGTSFWDTGNKGATTLGPSNTTPTDDTVDGTGQAARLETKFVGIGIIGKLAAGNIFAGRYVRTDGTNGILAFGREFTERPTRLTGYFKYQTAPISSASGDFAPLKGRPDTCIVWCALIDSDEPYEIRTNPSNRRLFDPDGPEVIAYGRMICGENVDSYAPFTVELDYKATDRRPKYILVTASASIYGDYFVGANGAVLYIDNFNLEYDY